MQFISHLKDVFKDKRYLVFFIFVCGGIYYLFDLFTYKQLIIGNYGEIYYFSHLISQIIISLLFALFLTMSVYKFIAFSSYSAKDGSTSFFATFVGILAAGCPACSITFASYIGLAGLLSLFPYDGLELKIIAIPLLGYANYSLSKSLYTCKISKRQKKVKKE